MAPGLSSNWKKLQAKIQAESPPAEESSSTGTGTSRKRKRQASSSKPPQSSSVRPKSAAPPPRDPSSSRRMGVTQSSAVARGTAATVTPSLALWAEDNDISPEDLAEAYGLGLGPGTKTTTKSTTTTPLDALPPERVNEGLAPGLEGAPPGRFVALDCEMVGVGEGGRDDALARVSVVDFHGRQVYDGLVRPRARVTDFRTRITGLAPAALLGDGARAFDDVRRDVAALLRGRVVVGHAVRHDFAVLELSHPKSATRDTAEFPGFKQYGHGKWPSLRSLAREILGAEIQNGHHSSVEDARATMMVFRRHKPEFDVWHANKWGVPSDKERAGTAKGNESGKHTKKKKKKRK
ncbi:ribonuclease H-like domain-containing protein [Xylariaceae sp. FL0804]|nr:ribonuclease H-like domain-containing protein [Xylariaceae sp. FL0804]